MPEPARPATASVPVEGTLLAFDYGEKRIGVALGNTVSRSARALETIPNRSVDFRFAQISRLVGEWQPVGFVVGMPVHPDGEEQPMIKLAKRFGNQLLGRYGLPVTWVDERYSSIAAQDAGASDDVLDAEAARIILQQFFDEHA
ncbi:putative Holliday junction resolvase [Ralstonia sp. GP73]|jgi:RNAse H-fold protein YqgF|uniref:Putative pre-16S rRNA nuclease n=2 Tax=Ralstonia TaxID=48736 RepID=YQGF_RALPJ|nr:MULTISPECIES: Holliday junction resolvase RuvX [Ralstonia]B2U7A9.1 RecName: Full=Putative pre-16S rRNA nuclease [Ralstonia pickettii 12J]MBT2180908.1 Holliday junction resolvase RuvX [Ralstonia pickettii]MDH6641955.1 putative Holliday junction resolvase [Ralstonia sp. GP73]OCS50244.1 Holliday junction DNA helicase RuvA [Ralstonia pickettii]CAJ0719072.1 Putative pre-16S rRNA nuclease [Ralstonia sp. LMG 18095]CAJ0789555.1 Putative pre-16S rRNA nuclease [Ralstonia sp. LMG 18095]